MDQSLTMVRSIQAAALPYFDSLFESYIFGVIERICCRIVQNIEVGDYLEAASITDLLPLHMFNLDSVTAYLTQSYFGKTVIKNKSIQVMITT